MVTLSGQDRLPRRHHRAGAGAGPGPGAGAGAGSSERGASLLELLIASTLFSLVLLSAFSWSGSLSATLRDQYAIQDQFSAANITRMRILGDADSSSSVYCHGSDQLRLRLGTSPARTVTYETAGGKLLRSSTPGNRAAVLVDEIQSLVCDDLGNDGIRVDIGLGSQKLPYHFHLRVSAGGGGA